MKHFNSLIDTYVQTQLIPGVDHASSEMAKEAFKSLIIEEVKLEYGNTIEAEIREEVKEEYAIKQQREKIKQFRNLIIESIFLATFVGLMVNQITDIVLFLKSGKENVFFITIVLIFSLIMALFLYIKFIYIDKMEIFLDDYFKKK